MSVDYILLYSPARWTILSLRQMRKFQLISRSPENLQKRCFSENFFTGKFDETSVFYALHTRIWEKLYEQQKPKNVMKTLSSTIRLRCESFASNYSRRLDQLVSPFFHRKCFALRRSSFYRKMFESSTPIQNQPCSPSVKGCISIM